MSVTSQDNKRGKCLLIYSNQVILCFVGDQESGRNPGLVLAGTKFGQVDDIFWG